MSLCALSFLGLAYQGKDIGFRFIIEYSSSLSIVVPRDFLVSFRGFIEDHIFAW